MNSIVGFTSIPMEFWKGPLRHYNLGCYLKCWHFIMEVSSGKFWTDHFLPSWLIARGILCRLFPVFCKINRFLIFAESLLYHYILYTISICLCSYSAFSSWSNLPCSLSLQNMCVRGVYMEIKLLSSAYVQLSEFPMWLPPYCLWYIFSYNLTFP